MSGIRFTLKELEAKGLISVDRARVLRQEMASLEKKTGTGRGKRQMPLEIVDGKKISRPHRILWEAVKARWPGRAVLEYPAIPGRRYSLDIAFPDPALRLAIEVDGYSHHARFLADFKKDRVRQNLVCLHGWRVLRYFPGEIYQGLDEILAQIEQFLENS